MYKFVDNVERKEINEEIDKQEEMGYIFVSFCQNNNSFDDEVGILFKEEENEKKGGNG